MTVPLSIALHNVTQEVEVLNVLYEYTADTVVPELLLESFLFGACSSGILIGSYVIWTRSCDSGQSFRTSMTLLLWSLYALLIVHWALNLCELLWLISGRAIGLDLTAEAVYDDAETLENQYGNDTARSTAFFPATSFTGFTSVWQYLLPLVTETALLGFSTVLLLPVVRAAMQKGRHRSWKSSSRLIPAMATFMYAISLTHWVASISLYHNSVDAAKNPALAVSFIGVIYSTTSDSVALLTTACLAFNTLFSDAIVLWRMCVVWNKARFAVVFCVALVSTTTGLTIANMVYLAGFADSGHDNMLDSEVIPTFGSNSLGLAAAFVSLASNICATLLVGLKAWRLRKDLRRGPSTSQRAVVERAMELLIDSGVAYTAIWVLYLMSFFFDITTFSPVLQDDYNAYNPITASSHLDAAMAQLTTIYPLIIVLLIETNRAPHAQKPLPLRPGQASTFAVTVDIDPETDVKHRKMLDLEAQDRDSGHDWRDSKDSW